MFKLFTDSDLDGLGCGLLAKLAFGDKVDVAYCTYHNLNQRVEQFLDQQQHINTFIFITDLSVNHQVEEKLEKRYSEKKNVQMLDHHMTALHFNKYDWAKVALKNEQGIKTCATSLFYDYLIEHEKLERNGAIEQFVELIREYDTWDWEKSGNRQAKQLNDLFSIIGREQFEAEMLQRLQAKKDSFSFNELEEGLLNVEEMRIDRYIRSKNRRLIQTFIHDYCVGIVHAESYHSELGNELNKRNEHLDLITIVNVGNKSMSFRTIHEHVDVSEFAKAFGGGGHPKASGCGLTEETFKLFIADVFSLQPRRPEPETNEFNVPNSPYGTYYVNRNNEISYIKKQENGLFQVYHENEEKESFPTFEEAERYVKRIFVSSLQYDRDFIKAIAAKLQISETELRNKFHQHMPKLMELNNQ